MLEALKVALAPREEKVELGGVALTVREMPSAASVEAMRDNKDLGYKLLVRCVFDAEGKLAFDDADIEALKMSAKMKLAPLLAAVNRVNGLAVEDEAKNSDAGPGAG